MIKIDIQVIQTDQMKNKNLSSDVECDVKWLKFSETLQRYLFI